MEEELHVKMKEIEHNRQIVSVNARQLYDEALKIQ
jgi:hypothetical protein